MPIRVLSEQVASQIAAGEVVERPASVVKELIENSLDAHATEITLQIEQAGRKRIEIADNGDGISMDEMPLAVARHSTSKLVSAEELFSIRTLGFRGEALASIASVARLTIVSAGRGATSGARMLVEGGESLAFGPLGAPQGTVVNVENLFYNVPARLKFLKKDTTERQQIDALVTRYAMAYPQVRFRLTHDGSQTLQTSGNGERREVLAAVYGVEIARQMLEVSLEDEQIQVAGFVSPVALTRSNRKEITFFVNGRWVQDSALSSALLQAYRTLLMIGRYPIAVLFIQMQPEQVDVNVHPAKAEVRFREPDRVFSHVQRAVKRALLAYSPVPQLETPAWRQSPSGWNFPAPSQGVDPAWDMAAELKYPQQPALPAAEQEENFSGETLPGPSPILEAPRSNMLPLLRLVGQVGAAYIVAEGPDGLYLIDQHAAHERVLFERLRGQPGKTVVSQALLEPVTVQLPQSSAQLLYEQIGLLDRLGFQVESFGPGMFQVRAVPGLLTGMDPAAALRVLVEDFEEDETPLQAEAEARLVARICKRAAVKAGQVLSVEEQKTLLRDLENCVSPRTCPHGRPTMIHLSVDLLERQFGRRGSR
jgi:DNA mismatch repair protein MutL